MASNPGYQAPGYPNGDPNNQPAAAWPSGYNTPLYPAQQGYPPANAGLAYPPPQPGYNAAVPYPSSQPVPYQAPPSYDESTKPVDYSGTPMVDYANDSYGGEVISFNDKSIRMGFIRRVFFILTIQLAVTVGTICLFMFCEPVNNFVKNDERGLWVYISSFCFFFVLYFVLVCCDSVRRSYPANLICLALFTLTLSYLVGTISSYHDTNIVLILMGVTALVCFSVMLFACQTKYDFTKWRGILFVCAMVLFFMAIFTPIWMLLNTTAGKIVLGGALALLFVAFLAYDVQLVMGGKKYELSPEEYIFASLTLYLDIIRIFLLLLAIFGRGSN